MKALVILAGGKSRRMGKDKTFLVMDKLTFLEHLIEKSAGIFDQVIISAGSAAHAQEIHHYLALESQIDTRNILIITDRYDSIGPMGGLMTIFEETGLAQFAVTAVDLPFADLRISSLLLDLLNTQSSDRRHTEGQPVDGPEASGDRDEISAVMLSVNHNHLEPCAAAYSLAAYAKMKNAYLDGQYGLLRAIGMEHIRVISADELKKSNPELTGLDFQNAFRNINTPQDLADNIV